MAHLKCFLVCACLAVVWSPLVVLAEPDVWDSRLDQICQLDLIDVEAQVPPGQWYWRLKAALFEDEVEAAGSHHIYVRCLDENGNGIVDQKFFVAWPYGNVTIDEGQCVSSNWSCALTKGPGIDQYYGNQPMFGGNCPAGNCGWPYSAFVSETSSPVGKIGLSDKIIGMGLHNPNGTPCNAHVSYRLTFQWTQAGPPPAPTIARSPAGFSHTIQQGDSIANDIFHVWNSGGSTLSYSITDNVAWLSVNPGGGISTGEMDPISVIYTSGGLGLGTFNATITISDPAATNSPQTVAVTVQVEPATVPGDSDGDGDVDMEDHGRFQLCLVGSGVVQNAPECAFAKMDGDIDVDQDDHAAFMKCLSGANIPGDPDCNQD